MKKQDFFFFSEKQILKKENVKKKSRGLKKESKFCWLSRQQPVRKVGV